MQTPKSGSSASASSSAAAPSFVAIACWLDLMGYGEDMNRAGFDPDHPEARAQIARLRSFQRIVSDHSGSGFPTLVLNDGAVAYSSIEPSRPDKAWRFLQRSWAMFRDVSAADRRNGGYGCRAVTAVGLRAKGSNRGIKAQETVMTAIIDDLVAGHISRDEAVGRARRYRREFDIIPQLQANFAFTRAYVAEQSGKKGGLPDPSFYLDTAIFKHGIPDWISCGAPIAWTHPKLDRLATSYVALEAIEEDVDAQRAHQALRSGRELLALFSGASRGPR